MTERPRCRRAAGVAMATAVALLVSAASARGHSIKLWVRVEEGSTIRGRAYTSGDRIRRATIEVLGPAEQVFGQVQTDDQGEFTYEATRRCDHTFLLRTGDGHRAESTVKAVYLPADLPALAGAPVPDGSPPRPPPANEMPPAMPDDEPLRVMLDAVVARQVGQLAEKLEAYEARQRLHDILGGVGYIVGITGVVFYFMAARKKPPQPGRSGPSPGTPN